MNNDHNLLAMMFNLTKAIRFCQQGDICGESITFVQFNILNLIYERQALKMADLHEALQVDKSTTTRLIEPLVAKQLVLKEKSAQDSRVILVRLTEQGRQVRDRAWACLRGFMLSVEMRIPADKRQEVYEAVKLYSRALSESCCCCRCEPSAPRGC